MIRFWISENWFYEIVYFKDENLLKFFYTQNKDYSLNIFLGHLSRTVFWYK